MSPKIPQKLYQKILEHMPICAVDFVLVNEGKVLLALRRDEPAKGQWFIPGGRLLKNESLIDAVRRKSQQEVGVKIDVVQKLGCYEVKFDRAPFSTVKSGIHYISICFLVKPQDKNMKIKLDNTQARYRWTDNIEKELHPYVKQVLKDAKVFT